MRKECYLFAIRQLVTEYVRVLSLLDDDLHRPGEAGEFSGPAVGNHGDRHLRRAAVHERAVLEDEGPAASIQLARDFLDRHVAAGSGRTAGAEHLAFA